MLVMSFQFNIVKIRILRISKKLIYYKLYGVTSALLGEL